MVVVTKEANVGSGGECRSDQNADFQSISKNLIEDIARNRDDC